ncbi:MAG: DciA family protein [Mariprofundaceae bacterium]|nr:DciA family protein [Mariprofundaceae bacterium]
MAKRKKSELKPIHVNMHKILGEDRMLRLSSIGILRRYWSDIVGNMMAQSSEPIAVEPQSDGSLGLIIAVNHSVVAQHIRLLHEEIRKACFKQCKLQGLSKVWTRVQAGAGIRESKIRHVQQQLSCQDLRKLAQSVQVVENKALRRAMFQTQVAQGIYFTAE